MFYDFRNFFKHQFHSIFRSGGKHFRLTPKRFGVLAIFYLLFPIVEIFSWAGLLLDELIYPNYHQQQIKRPVFVIGNYRSGTTFLHRLLAMDKRSFTAMAGWEIFIAPSIIQRKIIHKLAALDRSLGGYLYKIVETWWNKNIQNNVDIHTLGVTEPEEDESILGHIWSGIIPWNLFPIMENGAPEDVKFDTAFSDKDKQRVMSFYLRCVKRHLYANRRGTHYLSKSPSFSGKVDALYNTFPDAKIIYLVRNPLDVVPSQINMWAFKWNLTCDPLDEYPYKGEVLEMIKYWYQHPLERLEQAPKDSYMIVQFDELVKEPERIIKAIYKRFGFSMSARYMRRLSRAANRTRIKSRKKNKYSLREMGLTRKFIRLEFSEIFKRFRFRKSTRSYLRLQTRTERKQARLLRRQKKLYPRKSLWAKRWQKKQRLTF